MLEKKQLFTLFKLFCKEDKLKEYHNEWKLAPKIVKIVNAVYFDLGTEILELELIKWCFEWKDNILLLSVRLSSVDSFYDRYINQSGIYLSVLASTTHFEQNVSINSNSSLFYHPSVSAVSVVASPPLLWQIIQRNIF